MTPRREKQNKRFKDIHGEMTRKEWAKPKREKRNAKRKAKIEKGREKSLARKEVKLKERLKKPKPKKKYGRNGNKQRTQGNKAPKYSWGQR